MSKVLTTKQLESIVRGYFGYSLAIQSDYQQYRVLESDALGGIIQRIFDSFNTGDAAYLLEEYQIFQSWIDGVWGEGTSLGNRTDKAWERSWKLHKFPPGYLADHPSPMVLLRNDINGDHIPTLPQEPQTRVRINCEGFRRSIRVKDR